LQAAIGLQLWQEARLAGCECRRQEFRKQPFVGERAAICHGIRPFGGESAPVSGFSANHINVPSTQETMARLPNYDSA
jgi:hypothetical protein